MSLSQLGDVFRVLSYGESHGPEIGVVIDGVPAGLNVDESQIQQQLNRRRPGQSDLTTSRSEPDRVQITSGVVDGKTIGSPICMRVANTNTRSKDYDQLKEVYRPSHADYTYHMKYGVPTLAGGGRSSARVTAGWVAAGALAEQFLHQLTSIQVLAWVDSIHTIKQPSLPVDPTRAQIDQSPVRCPDTKSSNQMEERIRWAAERGDSLGGTIQLSITNCPPGLGDPVFGKLNAKLAHALNSLNAVKGIEFGGGFDLSTKTGSEVNDEFIQTGNQIGTSTNYSGGIQGGISNGMPITARIAFKPTSSISKAQQTVNQSGEQVELSVNGRHDPCVVPRAVPIVEALSAIVLMDAYLLHRIHQPAS
ncbi:MAG: chorismate synthase [Bacteroidetes bacterium]|nr:chorismate synthase [Bacteroidota bacterium]